MRVLIEPNQNEKVKRCVECGTLLAYTEDDVITQTEGGLRCVTQHIRCPVCGGIIYLMYKANLLFADENPLTLYPFESFEKT